MPYKDPDRQRQYFRDLYKVRKDDPAYQAIQQTAGKKWRTNNQKYGITLEDFQRMFNSQEGLCGICSLLMCNCGKQRGKCASQAEVDHDHKRQGRESVRGLICGACNRGLAAFRDRPDSLRNAISYLEAGQAPWID